VTQPPPSLALPDSVRPPQIPGGTLESWRANGPESASRQPGRFAGADPILFDLDGTLTASGPGILASVRHALAELDEPEPPALQRFIGPPLLDSFREFCGMDPDRAWAAVASYRAYYAERGQFESSVYDGVVEVLESLAAAGRVLAVATSKAEVHALSILEHFGLLPHFTAVVGSELDGARTDKAAVVAEVLARLDAHATTAVMIGDRWHDVVGARAAGVPCLGALWGYGSAEELGAAGAAALVATPRDLMGILLP
jgi:phosphoglycolate phosphatase